ncbi:MAG: GNAT family N-acetyltransferase [Thermomonas hydrothermalis]|uniref:GNAT family N-acetyltransferase n=1 Tax=Thermomonas hydrothermalis TaxID=213588 RepID=UPI002354161A|nr:GNAT family N-acetyltransferase [Thermomonas hydrothermalis]MCL6618783.1 GNAT family N-acetyltransferase [Thermomonas hydrothermalis]
MNTGTVQPVLSIRTATPVDVPLIHQFILELAEYERLTHAVVARECDLQAQLFGEHPAAEVLIGEVDGEPAGFALFFHTFSTFLGKRGLYLEDLYVRPTFRGLGLGRHLMTTLARLAVQRDCGRFEWSVLDWNQPAIDFYRQLGAVGMDDWTVQRLEGPALAALAARAEL